MSQSWRQNTRHYLQHRRQTAPPLYRPLTPALPPAPRSQASRSPPPPPPPSSFPLLFLDTTGARKCIFMECSKYLRASCVSKCVPALHQRHTMYAI